MKENKFTTQVVHDRTTPATKNAPLKDPKEIFYTAFEPKSPMRFLVYINDERTKEPIIPTFLIKSIDRPGYRLVDKKICWNTLRIRVYESIVPGGILFKLLKAGVFTIQVNELGPVGDVIETWVIPMCRFSSVQAKSLDWASDGGISIIEAEIDWKEIIVKDGDSEFKISKPN